MTFFRKNLFLLYMCKKIVLKGKAETLVIDRSLDFISLEIGKHDDVPDCDILVLSRDTIVALAGVITSARKLNPLCRIVVDKGPYQENLLSSLFPFVEFLRDGEILLSAVYSGDGTYKSGHGARSLSLREKKLLEPLSCGMSDKEIAFLLGISRRTVIRTKQRILDKAGLVSSSQLSVFCAVTSWLTGLEAVKKVPERVQSKRYERKRERNIQTS